MQGSFEATQGDVTGNRVPAANRNKVRDTFSVELVPDIADDDLDRILEGDDALAAAELVEHDGQMMAGGTHHFQKTRKRFGLRDEERRTQTPVQCPEGAMFSRSLAWTTPMISSGDPSTRGNLEWPDAFTCSRACS